MKARSLASIIKQHAFFAGLDDETLSLIEGCARNVRFEAGSVIARQGQPANHFYLIREGRVAVAFPAPQGDGLTIQTVDQDEIIGWSWLMPPYAWQFDVKAIQPVRAIAMDGKCLRGKCEQDTRLGYELMKRLSLVMVERLQAARLQLLDLYGTSQAAT